jgi:hypothetical protein
MFREHGHESVPQPEAFRIAIVPNDDRDLEGDPDLLMFDVGSEAAVPIEAWLADSTDGVETVGSELEKGDCGEGDVDGDDRGDDSPAVEPLRESEDPAPEPPDPEQSSEAPAEGSAEETSEDGDDRDTDSDGAGNPFSSV